jgi:hypothetical protein
MNGGSMSPQLSKGDARAIARVLYAVHQRRVAREAAEGAHGNSDEHEHGDQGNLTVVQGNDDPHVAPNAEKPSG